MTAKSTKPATRPHVAVRDEDITISPFDPVKFLDSEAAIIAHIEAALEENDLDLIIAALGDVIRARGIAAVAKEAGVGRESLYKTLAPGAKPKFDTVTKLLSAIGLRLSLASTKPAATRKKTVTAKAAASTKTPKTASTPRRRAQVAA